MGSEAFNVSAIQGKTIERSCSIRKAVSVLHHQPGGLLPGSARFGPGLGRKHSRLVQTGPCQIELRTQLRGDFQRAAQVHFCARQITQIHPDARAFNQGQALELAVVHPHAHVDGILCPGQCGRQIFRHPVAAAQSQAHFNSQTWVAGRFRDGSGAIVQWKYRGQKALTRLYQPGAQAAVKPISQRSGRNHCFHLVGDRIGRHKLPGTPIDPGNIRQRKPQFFTQTKRLGLSKRLFTRCQAQIKLAARPVDVRRQAVQAFIERIVIIKLARQVNGLEVMALRAVRVAKFRGAVSQDAQRIATHQRIGRRIAQHFFRQCSCLAVSSLAKMQMGQPDQSFGNIIRTAFQARFI